MDVRGKRRGWKEIDSTFTVVNVNIKSFVVSIIDKKVTNGSNLWNNDKYKMTIKIIHITIFEKAYLLRKLHYKTFVGGTRYPQLKGHYTTKCKKKQEEKSTIAQETDFLQSCPLTLSS